MDSYIVVNGKPMPDTSQTLEHVHRLSYKGPVHVKIIEDTRVVQEFSVENGDTYTMYR